ncbi:MAG: hypothetical protein KJ938_17505 [Actinobacteria bacterium]|nr:hypothetical protein [Actinomycetota bacterium]
MRSLRPPHRPRPPHRLLAVPLLVALAVTASGCGADTLAERATEKAAEKALEDAAAEGVEIDLDAGEGGISVETDDGSFTSGLGSLPAGFPEDVPVVGGEILNGASSQQDGTTAYIVTVMVQGAAQEAMAEAISALEDAGYSRTENSMSMGGLLIEMLTGPWEVTVGATDDGEGGTMLQYTVIEPQ